MGSEHGRDWWKVNMAGIGGSEHGKDWWKVNMVGIGGK